MNQSVTMSFISPAFLSEGDESIFFEWLGRFAENIHGVRDSIEFSSTLGDDNLREIIAIFFRYDIDMRPLAKCVTEENRGWFTRRGAYWYDRVFQVDG